MTGALIVVTLDACVRAVVLGVAAGWSVLSGLKIWSWSVEETNRPGLLWGGILVLSFAASVFVIAVEL